MPKQSHRKPARPKSEFLERVVQIDRVNRVVSGGRRLRFRATVVIGNMKGKVGVGIGKADEVSIAVQKAVTKAKRDLVTVNIERGTIPHQISHKFKASKILLFPARPGTGIIAGGAVRTVLELAGVRDILSKTHGSRHKINTTRATLEALQELQIFRELPPEKPVEKKQSAPQKKDSTKPVDGKKGPAPKPPVKDTKPTEKTEKPAEKKEDKKQEVTEKTIEAPEEKKAETKPAAEKNEKNDDKKKEAPASQDK